MFIENIAKNIDIYEKKHEEMDISIFNPQAYDEIRMKAAKYLHEHINGDDKNWMSPYENDYEIDYPVFYSPGILFSNSDDLAVTVFDPYENRYKIIIGDIFKLFDSESQRNILKYLSTTIDRIESSKYLEEADYFDRDFSVSPWFELNITPINDEEFVTVNNYKIYCHLVTAIHNGISEYIENMKFIYEMMERLGIIHDTKFYERLFYELTKIQYMMKRCKEFKNND